MAKLRPDPAAPVATISVRVPETIYAQVRELALRHDVTLGQAFDLLLDKVRIDARREVEELKAELAELQKKYAKVKKERDSYKKELDELDKVLEELTGEKITDGNKSRGRKKAGRSK